MAQLPQKPTDGLYNVELTVTDAEGLMDTATVSIAVGDVGNMPPVAVIEVDSVGGGAPLLVTFTGSNSTDDFGIVTYEWDFGDGSSSTEVDPEHIYTLPGSYTASLTVTDAEGFTNTTTLDILVTVGTKVDIILETNPADSADEGIVRIIIVNQPENLEVLNVTVHDIGGRYVAGHVADSIKVGNTYELPISTFGSGMYLVRVVTNDGESTLLKLLVAN